MDGFSYWMNIFMRIPCLYRFADSSWDSAQAIWASRAKRKPAILACSSGHG
jgi:hypothetical protein